MVVNGITHTLHLPPLLNIYKIIIVHSKFHWLICFQAHSVRNLTLLFAVVFQFFILPRHLPLLHGPGLGREVHAYLVQPTRVGSIGTGIAFRLYLRQGIVRRTVALELEDIDIAVGLHDAVRTALALLLLRIDRIDADQTEDEIERVMEKALLLRLTALAAHRVRECRQGRK